MSNEKDQALIDHLTKVVAFDLAKLEGEGLISRIGKSYWYRVPNLNALPHDWGIVADGIDQDSKGSKIKFSRRTQEAAGKLLRQLTGK
jgi:hypothetical protein